MRSRPWAWLRGLIFALLSAPASGYLEIPVDEKRIRYRPVWRTRLQIELYGEKG